MDLFSHRYDNNQESTLTLSINAKSFSGQNKKLFTLLMTGAKITFHDAYLIHGISDIRRRSKDLTDVHGVEISKGFLIGTRCKVWWMTYEQIEANKSMLKSRQ